MILSITLVFESLCKVFPIFPVALPHASVTQFIILKKSDHDVQHGMFVCILSFKLPMFNPNSFTCHCQLFGFALLDKYVYVVS